MNTRCLFTLMLLFIPPALFAQQARFDEATDYLEQQEYRQAIDRYKTIANDGYESGALWLNMGIAYAQLDSLGMARFYLLQAEQHRETEELAKEALVYVNERLNRRSAVLPPLPWDRFFEYLRINIGVNSILIVAFLFLYVGIAAIIFSWFNISKKTFLNASGLSSLGLSLLIFICAFYVNYIDNRYGTGVLTDRQTAVYEHPEQTSSQVSTAYEGYKMRVDFKKSENHPNWFYVRLENGMYGWIENDALNIF